ncbi:MAG: putative DNA-binding domain-containing protein [Pseudomonadota bacterium]
MPPQAMPVPPDLPTFQQHQLAFTARVRDPSQTPCPTDVPERRMRVYAELLYNGMESHLATNFPVLRHITPDPHWHQLVRDFFQQHTCRTGLFTRIGLEFLTYLEHERDAQADDKPFMLELAHYEYAELAVAISNEQVASHYDPNGDLLAGCPVVAPTAWNLTYCYPVHRISLDYLPDEPPAQPTHLVVYRDRLDQVHFLEINAVTQHLLTTLKAEPQLTGQVLLENMAALLQPQDPEPIRQAGAALLTDVHERNILLGARLSN